MTAYLAPLDFDTDAGVGVRTRIGLIALASDYTVEHEFRLVLRHLPGVALFGARIANDPRITPASLADMGTRLGSVAGTLLPGDWLDVVAYGCTSASMVLGPDRVAALIRSGKPDVAVTTPLTAAIAALEAFGARRVGVLTPYTRDINRGIQTALEGAGFTIPVFASFEEPSDPVVARIAPASIAAALERLAEAPVDALFVSCTSMRLIEDVAALEARLGLPVTSSNQALIWQTLRTAGITDPLPGLGRLFDI